MHSGALITVGITAYREGEWLRDCWRSVVDQTDERWVAVLVLDGSADRATRVVFESLQHPKLRKVALETNVGPYPARNKAFEMTETPYHFYVDGDDQLPPNSIGLVLESFRRHPAAAYVYGDYDCFGDSERILRFPTSVVPEKLAEAQQTPGACAYSVDAWRKLSGFAHELARGNADYDFLIGAFEHGLVGQHCGDVFYRLRVRNSGSVSKSYDLRFHETYEAIARRHPKFFSSRRLLNRFLSVGYLRAARANALAGNSRRAAQLAWTALRHGAWRNRELQLLVARGVLGRSGLGVLRVMWHGTNRLLPK